MQMQITYSFLMRFTEQTKIGFIMTFRFISDYLNHPYYISIATVRIRTYAAPRVVGLQVSTVSWDPNFGHGSGGVLIMKNRQSSHGLG